MKIKIPKTIKKVTFEGWTDGVTKGNNRCECNGDFGSRMEEDRVNFDRPMQVIRCNRCDGILEKYYLW